MARILIAATTEGSEILAELLGAHDFVYADDTNHALDLCRSENPPDVVICALLFDDSRMFDLLRALQSEGTLQRIVFICVRVIPGSLPKAALDGLDVAARALGARAFIDVAMLLESGNRDAAKAMLEDCIPRVRSRD